MSEKDDIGSELCATISDFCRKREQRISSGYARGEAGLLHYLAFQQDGVSPGVLREQLGVGSGRMADILKSLEEKRLIVREADPGDSRRVIVHITAVGRDHALRVNERMLAWYCSLSEYLGAEDSRELVRLLKRMNEYCSGEDACRKAAPAAPAAPRKGAKAT